MANSRLIRFLTNKLVLERFGTTFECELEHIADIEKNLDINLLKNHSVPNSHRSKIVPISDALGTYVILHSTSKGCVLCNVRKHTYDVNVLRISRKHIFLCCDVMRLYREFYVAEYLQTFYIAR